MTAQQLKNSILQMAVQGKLVPQDPNDEPASVLLERIRNEKEKLVKAGKIKQKKNPSVIFRGADNIPYEKIGDEVRDISDEIPFEIPDSWEWVRLGSLLSVISDGTHKTPTYVENGIPFLSVQNISKGFFDFNKIKYITKQEHDKLSERVSPKKDDILICRIGTLGKAIKCTLDFEFSIFVSLGLLRPVDPSIVDYIIFVINSPIGDKWIQNNKVGGGTHTYKINLIDIPNMLIPLPPLQEQTRISDKLQEIDPYLSEYEKDDNKLDRLSMSFPDQLKKSILQQAVQGKLVEQDPNDEPASVLLERIRAEKQRLVKEGKIKKDKHDSFIYRRDNSHYEKSDGIERCIDDEIPFEIPDSWEWVRLKTLFNIVSARRVHQSDWRKEGVPFYRAREIGKLSENGVVNNELFINEELYDKLSKSGIPSANDIMMTAVGTLGKTYVVKPTDRFYYKDASVICLENFSNTSPFYIKLAMQSPYMCEQIKECSSGTTVGTVTIVKASDYLIPLPPSCEQKRIVDAYRGIIEFTNKLG